MALVKYNDRSLRNLTTVPAAVTNNPGALVHIKTLTASSSGTLSFVDGSDSVVLDNTYPIYKFEFINIHPATNNADFTFQADTGTNTNYNQTMTTTSWRGYHSEDDSEAAIGYDPGRDQAQGTAFQVLAHEIGNGNDENIAMTLTLFNPSSSVFVKHFIATNNINHNSGLSENKFVAGYFNTTTALTRVQFKMSSGNIDAGQIKLYGIKDA
tara:strand:- start:650 stop:1282 length:633 start_codon:yes stop_codon:yes gene_type:complete